MPASGPPTTTPMSHPPQPDSNRREVSSNSRSGPCSSSRTVGGSIQFTSSGSPSRGPYDMMSQDVVDVSQPVWIELLLESNLSLVPP